LKMYKFGVLSLSIYQF